jgi:adenine/guanine phosphoribosyltransferase-like PRPP-binding protein
VALAALAWILADTPRAERFLALTGLTPDSLRASVGEPATHRAVLEFLCAHEPDLVAAAESLGLAPAALAGLRDRIAP